MFEGFCVTEEKAISIKVIQKNHFEKWLSSQAPSIKNYIEQSGFGIYYKPINLCFVPNPKNEIEEILFAVKSDLKEIAILPRQLPSGNYKLDLKATDFTQEYDQFLAAFYWALGCYQFKKYRTLPPITSKLVLPSFLKNHSFLNDLIESNFLARDLINTPAQEMMPQNLAEVVVEQAKKHRAKIEVITNQKILEEKYPCVYAVGKGSTHSPCFIDMTWGNKNHPKITLIGKGICFDTGGLDIKTSEGMYLMKKDMSGGVHALALSLLIMRQQLPIRLRLLIPAAENAVSGNSYHPGDVIRTRSGLSIEIFNTDAEGRLVLCDALFEASQENPEQIIDFSTLTGAARIALGPEIPAFFCNNETMAENILRVSQKTKDMLWRMPLYQPYRMYLKSSVADMMNASKLPFAGSIVAALFLESFVKKEISWVHFDMSAWNYTPMPGLEEGAEIMAIRTMYEYLSQIYST